MEVILMARRKGKRYHSKRKMTIPVAPAAAIFATLAGPATQVMAGNFKKGAEDLYENYVGANKIPTYTALAVGFGMHIVASKVGANRVLGQMGIPVFRI